MFLCLALSFSPVALRNKGAGAIPDLRSEAQTSLFARAARRSLGALLDGVFLARLRGKNFQKAL